MSRLPPKKHTDYPWWLRVLFWLQKRKYGVVLAPALIWGRSPSLLIAITHFFRSLERAASPLAPVLRALVTVRVSQLNHCEFCVDINSARVLESGGAKGKIVHLAHAAEYDGYTNEERVALELAECITVTGRTIEDELWNKVHETFSDDAIVELIALISFQNLSSKFNAALDIAPQGFCSLAENN